MRKVCHSRCRRRLLLALLVPLAACASPQAYQPAQKTQAVRAVETPKRNDPAEPLSPAARALLKSRMASHARDMNDLVLAIMTLDYLRIEQRGDQIADDVSLSRPVTNDATELNAALPEKFFVHQDKLKLEARALADAARARNPYRVAEQYGRLSEGCVRCHADYRPRS
jgi:cytochrome c556